MRPLRPLLGVVFATMACEVGSCGPSHLPASSPGASQGAVSSASVSSASSASSAAPPADPSLLSAFDLAALTPLQSHPALADVRAALLAKDPRAAADALAAALSASKITGPDLDRARFMLGRLSQQAKDEERAEAAYAQVSGMSALFPHAALRRATIAGRRGKIDDALARLVDVPRIAPFLTDLRFVEGDARAAKGDHLAAADQFAEERKGPRAFEAVIRWAEEVAAAAKAADAFEAASAVRRARFEHASSSLASRAEDAETKCKALLPAAQVTTLGAATASENASAAQSWFDVGKFKEALAVAQKIVAAEKKGSDAWCRAASIVARVHERLRERPRASDAYGEVEGACADEAMHVSALYDGAKAALSAKSPDLARARFSRLEKDHPKHRLADDARLRGALATIDQGDLANVTKGEAMLAALPDDYPDGDMRAEALFRLALPRMKRGEWAAAIPFLEKALTIAPREEGYFVAGRTLYFLGRAKLETGQSEDGLGKLREVIAREPLTFAAAMAYARLAAHSAPDAASAKKALDQGLAFEPTGVLFDERRKETTTASFARGIELARVGESDWARKELAAAGLLTDATKDPEAQWLVASIFAKLGDAKSSHGFPRSRLNEWNRHFPGGKWRKAWEIAFPRAYADLVEPIANKAGVPAPLVWAVMREESAFDPEAASPSAAYGLLQLIVPTATHYAKSLNIQADARTLLRPDVNVPLGVAYLKKLRTEFPDNPGLAVPSYNAGEGATHRWLSPPLADSFDLWVESIPYDETRKYTKRVLASYWAYVALYEPAGLDAALRAATGQRSN